MYPGRQRGETNADQPGTIFAATLLTTGHVREFQEASSDPLATWQRLRDTPMASIAKRELIMGCVYLGPGRGGKAKTGGGASHRRLEVGSQYCSRLQERRAVVEMGGGVTPGTDIPERSYRRCSIFRPYEISPLSTRKENPQSGSVHAQALKMTAAPSWP